MKKLLLIFVIAIAVNGCDLVNSNGNSALSPVFSISDIAGQSRTNFHQGESFKLSFSLNNTTGDTVIYTWGSPMVSFRIYKNDSVVTSSDYGCPEPNFYTTSLLPPDQSIQGSWEGPTPRCDTQKVVLSPGKYLAQVYFPNFGRTKVKAVLPLSFNVIR